MTEFPFVKTCEMIGGISELRHEIIDGDVGAVVDADTDVFLHFVDELIFKLLDLIQIQKKFSQYQFRRGQIVVMKQMHHFFKNVRGVVQGTDFRDFKVRNVVGIEMKPVKRGGLCAFLIAEMRFVRLQINHVAFLQSVHGIRFLHVDRTFRNENQFVRFDVGLRMFPFFVGIEVSDVVERKGYVVYGNHVEKYHLYSFFCIEFTFLFYYNNDDKSRRIQKIKFIFFH